MELRFKKLLFLVLILLITLCALFPKQIVLKYVEWKAKRYCLQAFDAHLLIDTMSWKDGVILIKGGKLYRRDQIDASFDVASLVPKIDWTHRVISGTLSVDGLKIIHKKKVSLPVPTPAPPSFKFFSLQCDTTIEAGELFLYDYVGKNHFFRHASFDVIHHVHENEASGTLIFQWEPQAAPVVAHFKTLNNIYLELSAEFPSCSFPLLAYLTTYFFHNYLPPSLSEWEAVTGRAEGGISMVFINGKPAKLSGHVSLNDALAQRQPTEAPYLYIASCEKCHSQVAIDFSSLDLVDAIFEIEEGSFGQSSQYIEDWGPSKKEIDHLEGSLGMWQGQWTSSCLKGDLLGMPCECHINGARKREEPAVITLHCSGAAGDIAQFLSKWEKSGSTKVLKERSFSSAFSHDSISLNAQAEESEKGIVFHGELTIANSDAPSYQLRYGGLLGPNTDCAISGWFQGDHFPLAKFLGPFLLDQTSLTIHGHSDFSGTFDHEHIHLNYMIEDFILDGPQFQLAVAKEQAVNGNHDFYFGRSHHTGLLLLNNASYNQKNYHFQLEHADARVFIENHNIDIKNLTTTSEGLSFEGEVKVAIFNLKGDSKGDSNEIELTIDAERLQGTVAAGQHFLSHFTHSSLLHIPITGDLYCEDKPLHFHYRFSPTATLIEGHIHTDIYLAALPALGISELPCSLDYDCKKQFLCCRDGDLQMVLTSQVTPEGHAIILQGQKNKNCKIHVDALAREDRLTIREFTCGRFTGKGELDYQEDCFKLNNCVCTAKDLECIFSGCYDINAGIFQSDIRQLKKDDFALALNEEENLLVTWKQGGSSEWTLDHIEGKLLGIEGHLTHLACEEIGKLTFEGLLTCSPQACAPFLPVEWQNALETLSCNGNCNLEGIWTFDRSNIYDVCFEGKLEAENCQIKGLVFDSLKTELTIDPKSKNISLKNLVLKDCSGELKIDEARLSNQDNRWLICMNQLVINKFCLSRLRSPWSDSLPRQKSFFRFLFVPACVLNQFIGEFGDWESLQGNGVFEFTNIPKKTLFSHLMLLPIEITARIGLDMTNFIPVCGRIHYKIEKGKIIFNEFKGMYSEGKRSRFYLAEGSSAYLDFNGNLNMRVKMKQYNLLMKLAEFLTITVKGTLLNPTYSFLPDSKASGAL